ncbi:MAG: NAD-dependent epimerase/dehydratase family protein [Candidatus Heimdallarchaeota archaeon]
MRYLVTGGAGFLGSHLIEALLQQGHSIVCLDDFSTGKKQNLQACINRIEVVSGDLRDSKTVQSLVKEVEAIYHLGAQISVSRSVREPLYDASVNINGILNVLNAACKNEISRVVFTSTGGAIYGEPKSIPASETMTESPESPYGLSKLSGEKYVVWYHKQYGLSYGIIRPANIFGPRQDPLGEAGVISIFLDLLRQKKPLTIFGNGLDTRDYVYVDDIVDLCVKVMGEPMNEVFNGGTGQQTSVLDLINIIEQVTGLKADKQFYPPRPGDIHHIALDSKKALRLLGWTPKTDLYNGIEKTWNWFKSF